MTSSDSYRHCTRAQAAIRMKQLTLDNQSRVIKKLKAHLAERRQEVEDLTTAKTAAEKLTNEVFQLFEVTRSDNFDLPDII